MADTLTVTVDSAFKAVIAGCAAPQPGRDDTWINKRIRDLYFQLYQLGHAHSVEAWREGWGPLAVAAEMGKGDVAAACARTLLIARPPNARPPLEVRAFVGVLRE